MSNDLICKSCGHYGDPSNETRGSFSIELILWLCFLVPGLVYSLWRLSTRRDVCAKCGSADLIPIDSPLGKKLFQDIAPQVSAAVAVPYRPTTGRRGGLAWRLGALFSRKN